MRDDNCFRCSFFLVDSLSVQEKFLSNAEEAMKQAVESLVDKGTSGLDSASEEMEEVEPNLDPITRENGNKRRFSNGTHNEVQKIERLNQLPGVALTF